ncbi:MAG TPA: TolC family protein, partial [Bryobacteraceae bacterium]|nr:TolC family protein [Bryobacteraceae bacterium]
MGGPLVRLQPFLMALCLSGAAFAQGTLRLTLKEAEKIAIQNNPRFAGAKYSAAAAGQIPSEISANFQPTLFGSLTGVGADGGSRLAAGGLNNPVVYNRLGSGLSISQLITDFGRTGSLVESAKLRAKAEDQVTESTRAEILLATDRAYFDVLRTQALEKVAEQTVAARQLVAEQVTALAQASLKSTLDVSFANVNLADARLQLAGARNNVNAALAVLATAMGIPGQQAFTLEEEAMPAPLPDTVLPLIQQALQDRPELASLRLQQNASGKFAEAERALSRPSIGVIATGGFSPAGQDTVPGRYGALGVNVNVPIFNGGLFKARRSEAELRSQAAAQSVKDLENRIARDVRVAFLEAATADARVGLANEFLKQAQLALDLAQSRYD